MAQTGKGGRHAVHYIPTPAPPHVSMDVPRSGVPMNPLPTRSGIPTGPERTYTGVRPGHGGAHPNDGAS